MDIVPPLLLKEKWCSIIDTQHTAFRKEVVSLCIILTCINFVCLLLYDPKVQNMRRRIALT